jgi:hypothetical protein
VAGGAAFQAMVNSRAWSLWVGVWVLSATSPPTSRGERLRLALVDGYEVDTLRWSELHGGLAVHLGLRLREAFTLRQFTVAVGALVEGCALRQIGADELSVIDRPTGPGGSMEQWSLYGVVSRLWPTSSSNSIPNGCFRMIHPR